MVAIVSGKETVLFNSSAAILAHGILGNGTPDSASLAFWSGVAARTGAGIAANYFLITPESAQRFPTTDSDAAFIQKVFVAALARQPSATQYLHNDVYASAGSATTRYSYDRLGHVVKTTSAATAVYQADNQLHRLGRTGRDDMGATLTGVAAQETIHGYDELGRRISTTIASANTAQAATVTSKVFYDAAGNIAATRDAFGYGSRMTYDNFGHQLSVTDAEGGRQSWSVDAYGRVLSHTDLERITTTYTYTSAGQRATARSKRERTDYSYDQATGALLQVDTTLGGVHTTATYGYDLAGNRTVEKTVADGRLLQNQVNTYDRTNRLVAIDASGIRGASYAVRYRFDQNGNRIYQHTGYTTDAGDAKDIEVVNTFDRMNREDGTLATSAPSEIKRSHTARTRRTKSRSAYGRPRPATASATTRWVTGSTMSSTAPPKLTGMMINGS